MKTVRHYFVCIAALGFSVLSLSPAASRQDPGFKMPCAQMLRMGFDKFTEVYVARTKDDSELGHDTAAEIYSNCKSADNDRRSQRLSAARRRELTRIRTNLAAFENSVLELAETKAGGGTMYTHAANRAGAAREDLLGIVITSLHKQDNSSATRRESDARLADIHKKLRSNADPDPVPDFVQAMGSTPAQYRQTYRSAYLGATKAEAAMQILLAAMPAGAAWQIAGYMRGNLSWLDPLEGK